MSCLDETFLEYFEGDNQEIEVIITDQNGERIPDIVSDTTEIVFFAEAVDPLDNIELKLTTGKISFAEVDDKDVATIKPSITDTQVPPGDYPVFMRLTLVGPPRNFHVEMTVGGVPFKFIKILETPIT